MPSTAGIEEQTRNVVFVTRLLGRGDEARDPARPRKRLRRRARMRMQSLRSLLATIVSQTADAEEIFLVDLAGTVKLSTFAGHEGASVAREPFFMTGQRARRSRTPIDRR
jgi:hypothetical protein